MTNTRQEQILLTVITHYINTGNTVASRILVEEYALDVSPATVRAEMMNLESDGYLFQPHTSAGRIPTDRGFRFYVDHLRRHEALSRREQALLDDTCDETSPDVRTLLNRTVTALSELLDCSSIATSPESDVYFSGASRLVHQPDFDDIQKIRNVIEMLEERQEIIEHIKRVLQKQEMMLLIGAETEWPLLADCSVMAAQYHIQNKPAGIIGLITAKRTRYDRAQSAMGRIVERLDDAMERLYA